MRSSPKNFVKKLLIGIALFFLLFVICNDFLLPWYVEHGSTIEVPDVVGMTLQDASRILDSLGLEGRQGDVRPDREHPAGIVVVQNPIAGHAVKKGRRVYLTVSGGEESVNVPSVRGRTLRDATFLLERTGLRIGDVSHEPSEEYPVNTIIDQSHAPGEKVRKDTRVDVTVSLGPVAMNVAVPELIGKSLSEAKKLLETAGMTLGNVTYIPSGDLLPNTVIEQYPHAGELVEARQAIDLVVVQGAAKDKKPSEY
jgi:beta-lactam-binding protein with PASTA domain